ncbi:cell division ATP-binding protein FtsE [Gryllotalpicola sp.]|uniref:cell division ATP-binding protein FtsE n=1 Tax=Gryllotalpicola sp. TaxID=1932787 RepID=UPI002639ECD6|nr:cell division ATP-binding protein FtsE [Gryllotalpicola sp.]
MIKFEHVSKQYRGTPKPALDDVSFEVQRGEFVFLIGSSGSGKTSCLRLILKEDRPSRGAIHVLGQDLGTISTRKVPFFRRNLGVVFQDFRLLPNKTVYQNVAFTLQVIGQSRGFIQEAVPDVLETVGLGGKGDRMPHELSGGEQQRVAIARAVVNKPQILLADEPTGNLDPATSAGIMAVLQRINAAGTTVVMATHEAGLVDQMQKRVIELVGGRIIRDEREAGYGDTVAIPVLKPAPAPAPEQPVVVQLPTGVVAPVAAPAGARIVTAPVTVVAPEVVPPLELGIAERLGLRPTGTEGAPDGADQGGEA